MKKFAIFFEPEVYSYASFWAHSSITYLLERNKSNKTCTQYIQPQLFNRIPWYLLQNT